MGPEGLSPGKYIISKKAGNCSFEDWDSPDNSDNVFLTLFKYLADFRNSAACLSGTSIAPIAEVRKSRVGSRFRRARH